MWFSMESELSWSISGLYPVCSLFASDLRYPSTDLSQGLSSWWWSGNEETSWITGLCCTRDHHTQTLQRKGCLVASAFAFLRLQFTLLYSQSSGSCGRNEIHKKVPKLGIETSWRFTRTHFQSGHYNPSCFKQYIIYQSIVGQKLLAPVIFHNMLKKS